MASNSLSGLLEEQRLQPLRDAVAGAASAAWRRAFVAQVDPRADDVIVEIGCGEGAMTLMLAAAAPRATLIAVDPDPAALARAEERALEVGARAIFLRGLGRDLAHLAASWAPTKVVASLVLRAAPLHEQTLILRAAHQTLRSNGSLHIADYGVQSTALMRGLYRAFAGEAVSEAGTLPKLMREAGFKAVDEARRFSTIAGSVSLFSARAN